MILFLVGYLSLALLVDLKANNYFVTLIGKMFWPVTLIGLAFIFKKELTNPVRYCILITIMISSLIGWGIYCFN